MALVRWTQGGRRAPTGPDSRDDDECFYEEDLWPARGLRGAPRRPAAPEARGFSPRIDVIDTAKEVVVRADLPGLEREDIEVTITKDIVVLKGERKDHLEGEAECSYCREVAFGAFERQIQLPESVLADEADATLKNGVLTLTIPKTEPKGAVRIKVS